MQVRITGSATWQTGAPGDIELRLLPSRPLDAGTRLWLLCDIRQDVSAFQVDDPAASGYIEVHAADGGRLAVAAQRARTLDLYPEVPEFLHVAEVWTLERLADDVRIILHDWQAPRRPIDPFRFWVLVSPDGAWNFRRTGYKSYRVFTDRDGQRIPCAALRQQLVSAELRVEGGHDSVPAPNTRKTPGIFWGELHGMAFNQRPLDDFYNYAKQVTHLDFAAAMRFSYNTCVGNVWQQTKEAAARHTQPGRFVAFAGFECGTPGDDSHRCAYFPHPEAVPPIFCDSRPPAQDPHLQARFHPATVHCRTLAEFYATVEAHGGFVGGHFHTVTYDRELLAEIWQKQAGSAGEEERLFQLLRKGLRFGLVGGSDTHDSMPGNPAPEPGCPQPAGFTGVWTDALTPDSLAAAFHARRVFATSGARISLWFDCNGRPLGSVLPVSAPRRFRLRLDAPAEIKTVELLRNGHPARTWTPHAENCELEYEDTTSARPAFYLARVTQTDGHRAWSSPIWFEKAG